MSRRKRLVLGNLRTLWKTLDSLDSGHAIPDICGARFEAPMRTPDTFPASPAPNRAQVSQASTLIGAGLAGGVSLERLAMKTKHTPEPWKWDESWGAIVVDRPDMQKLICPMWTGCDRARMGRDVVDEDLANARLIASAPDLYAIVRAEYDEHDGFRTLPMGYPADRAAAICAAIAKAEGGAH